MLESAAVLLLVSVTAARANTWRGVKPQKTWVSAISCTSPNECFVTACEQMDSCTAFKSTSPSFAEMTTLPIYNSTRAIAIAMENTTHGVGGGTGLFYTTNGEYFNTSKLSPAGIMTFAVYSLGNNEYVAPGVTYDPQPMQGVMHSTDGGRTFNFKAWDQDLTPSTRSSYGAFPSKKTWYVTTGDHPGFGGGMWAGKVLKTTDAGLTWSVVYSSRGVMMLTGISCVGESFCVTVGWSFDPSNAPGLHVLRTTNGGANWTETLHFGEVLRTAATAVHMSSETDGWIAAGVRRPSAAVIMLRTTDGGLTWTENTVLPEVEEVMQMSFPNAKTGYAVALLKDGSGAVVLEYNESV